MCKTCGDLCLLCRCSVPHIAVVFVTAGGISRELTIITCTGYFRLGNGDGQVIGRYRHVHRGGAHVAARVFDSDGTRIHQLLILLSNKSSSCRGLADKSNRTTNFSSGS